MLTGCLPKEQPKNNSNTIFNPAYLPGNNAIVIDGIQTKRYQPSLTSTWNSAERFNFEYDQSLKSTEKTVSKKLNTSSVVNQKPIQTQHNLKFKKEESKILEVKFLDTEK
jgi:hypothetical protein